MYIDTSRLQSLQAACIRADFHQFCRAALAPYGQVPARHHQLVIAKLQAVAEGKIPRLMLLMPPGSAKSTYASVLFPAWYFAQRRRLTMIAASNTVTLAKAFSRKSHALIRDLGPQLGYSLATDAVEEWTTDHGCEYKAVGAGGAVAGRRADVAIIDDPFRSRADANSDNRREFIWNWFRGDIVGRLKPGGSVVLVNTHWHQDDLTGRLLDEAATGGRPWDVVLMQAIYDGTVQDPMGRDVGQALWPEWEDEAALALKRQEVGESEWGALFQQNPRIAEGTIFKIGKFDIPLETEPAGGQVVRAWDLAGTAQTGTRNPDYTAGVRLARMPDKTYVVQDVVRHQCGPEDTVQLIRATAAKDGRSVKIGLPQDPGQAGKFQVSFLTRDLAGYRVESSPETGDKETRAGPIASQLNVGNVRLVEGPWNRAFIEELAAFPVGTKDDQVDALSRAFMMLSLAPPPMRIAPGALRAPLRHR